MSMPTCSRSMLERVAGSKPQGLEDFLTTSYWWDTGTCNLKQYGMPVPPTAESKNPIDTSAGGESVQQQNIVIQAGVKETKMLEVAMLANVAPASTLMFRSSIHQVHDGLGASLRRSTLQAKQAERYKQYISLVGVSGVHKGRYDCGAVNVDTLMDPCMQLISTSAVSFSHILGQAFIGLLAILSQGLEKTQHEDSPDVQA